MGIDYEVGLFDDKEFKDTIEKRRKELKRQLAIVPRYPKHPSLLKGILSKLRLAKPTIEEIKTELDESDLYHIVLDSNSYEDLSGSFNFPDDEVVDFDHLFASKFRGVKEAKYIEDLLGLGMFTELGPDVSKWRGSFGIKQGTIRTRYISSENIHKHGKKLISLLKQFDIRKAIATVPKKERFIFARYKQKRNMENFEIFRDNLIKIIELAQSKKKGIVLLSL
jgi:hypothetical protein